MNDFSQWRSARRERCSGNNRPAHHAVVAAAGVCHAVEVTTQAWGTASAPRLNAPALLQSCSFGPPGEQNALNPARRLRYLLSEAVPAPDQDHSPASRPVAAVAATGTATMAEALGEDVPSVRLLAGSHRECSRCDCARAARSNTRRRRHRSGTHGWHGYRRIARLRASRSIASEASGRDDVPGCASRRRRCHLPREEGARAAGSTLTGR